MSPFLRINPREQSYLAQGQSHPLPRNSPYPMTGWCGYHGPNPSSLFRTMSEGHPSSKAPHSIIRGLCCTASQSIPHPSQVLSPSALPHKLHADLSLFPGELDQPMKGSGKATQFVKSRAGICTMVVTPQPGSFHTHRCAQGPSGSGWTAYRTWEHCDVTDKFDRWMREQELYLTPQEEGKVSR